jgi:hypothetical protein
MRNAFAALLKGDTAERDRWCTLARNLMDFQARVHAGEAPVADPIKIKPATPAVIYLPDRSREH